MRKTRQENHKCVCSRWEDDDGYFLVFFLPLLSLPAGGSAFFSSYLPDPNPAHAESQ